MGIALFSMRFRFRLTGYCGAIMEKKMGVEKRETRRLRRKFNGLPADGFFSSVRDRMLDPYYCSPRTDKSNVNAIELHGERIESVSNFSRTPKLFNFDKNRQPNVSLYRYIKLNLFETNFPSNKSRSKAHWHKKKKKIRRKTHPNKNSKGGNDRYDTRNS